MMIGQAFNPRAARLLPCALAAALLLGCEQPEVAPPPPLLLPVLEITDPGGLSSAPFPGRARAAQEVNLSFRVAGPLVEFPVEVGDEVAGGTLMAQMDPTDYISALRTAEGQLERARAAAERAEADFQRISNVYRQDPGATSETALDLARAARDGAVATVSSLEATVGAAEDQVSYTSLQAPFDGVVVATYVENFETVLPRQPILRLLDPSSIEFVINVPENLVGYTPFVESVEVTFDAFPDVAVPARITEVGREASEATRTFPITLQMTQPEGAEILPGMAGSATVTARLPESSERAGIEVPGPAVFTTGEPPRSFVWIVDTSSNTVSARAVEVGRLTATGVRVLSGLEPGETIAVRGVNSLTEGQRIRPTTAQGGGARP